MVSDRNAFAEWLAPKAPILQKSFGSTCSESL
jgi:hypothetical protein